MALTEEQIRQLNNMCPAGKKVALGDVIKAIQDDTVDVMRPPEAYDPTVTGDYPLTYDSEAIEKGDSYRITAAGTMGAITVNPEDLLIALTDAPAQVDANWQCVESNRDQASETVKGVAELATQAETDAFTDDERIVTPLKLGTCPEVAQVTGAVASSAGAGDAGKLIELDAGGLVDPTMLPDAAEDTEGIAEIATQVETDAFTDDARIVTPLKLGTCPEVAQVTAAVASSAGAGDAGKLIELDAGGLVDPTMLADAAEDTEGIAELATQVETDAGTDDARIVTPLKLATKPEVAQVAAAVAASAGAGDAGKLAELDANGLWDPTMLPDAGEAVEGIAEIATQVETDAFTDDARIVTPLKLGTTPEVAQVTAAVNSSAGAGDAGKLIELDASGLVDPTMVPLATETAVGGRELATQAETDTGTDDTTIVTPLKLATLPQVAQVAAAVAASAGAGDAGKLVELDAGGAIDTSMLPELMDNVVDAVIAVADAGSGATGAALTVDIKDLAGAAKSKVCEGLILASDTQYAGRDDQNANVTFGTATLGSILASGSGWCVFKTDANGQFACTATNAVDETVYFSVKTAEGGVDALAAGVAVRGCVPDDATWSA